MKVDAQNYEQMKAWFALMVAETTPAELLTPETHPIAIGEAMAARSLAKARQGLTMAINDTLEMTEGWSAERVAEIDALLERHGLPSLTEVRLRFSKVIRRVVARGIIKNDVEYYAVRNAAELASDQETLWKLLAAYEEQVASRGL
jgi:hypothetical protein